MNERWPGEFGNAPNRPLEQGWEMIDSALMRVIKRNRNGDRSRWEACANRTGTGKSQLALIEAAIDAMRPEDQQDGFLIVQALTDDVDASAARVNALSKPGSAVAYHSKLKERPPLDSLSGHQTLCITHAALIAGLEELTIGTDRPKWGSFYAFRPAGSAIDRTRTAIIVDEELALVSSVKLEVDDIDQLLFALDSSGIRGRYLIERENLGIAKDWFERMQQKMRKQTMPDQTFRSAAVEHIDLSRGDMKELRRALREESLFKRFRCADAFEEQRIHAQIDSTLGAIKMIMSNHIIASRVDGEVALLSSRLLLPDGVSALILDATCKESMLCEMSGIDIREAPPGARRYDSVKLYTSRGKAGKTHMKKKPMDHARRLLDDIEKRYEVGVNLAPEKDIFVVVPMSVEPHLKAMLPGDEDTCNVKVNHFGNINGSNAYRHARACFIMAIPFKPPYWAAQQIFATVGVQETGWFAATGDRSWKQYPDLKKAVTERDIIAALVQAVNRICIRTTVDGLGNAPPASLFVVFPTGEVGDTLRGGLIGALPGCQHEGAAGAELVWDLEDAKKIGKSKPREFRTEAALIAAFASLGPGKTDPRMVWNEFHIPYETSQRYIQRILKADPADPIVQAMKKEGIEYGEVGRKRGKKSWFMRKS